MTSHVFNITLDEAYTRARAGRPLFYNYTASKIFCYDCGLVWVDGMVIGADRDAWGHGFSQAQVDVAMRHYLWAVKFLFQPNSYRYWQRILLAFFFLTGWKPK